MLICNHRTGEHPTRKEVNKMLETRKKEAKKNLIEARNAWMEEQTNENWIAFCEARRLCRLLGVLV